MGESASKKGLETCNAQDDDCDGLADNGFNVGLGCDGPDADNCANGTVVCTVDGQGTSCDESGAGTASEVCDGLDTDFFIEANPEMVFEFERQGEGLQRVESQILDQPLVRGQRRTEAHMFPGHRGDPLEDSRVVESVPADQPIVFAPDRHLARWVAKQTGREMVVWPGFCVVHEQFSARRLLALKAEHPNAQLIAHPECDQSVLAIADHVGSTASLLNHVKTAEQDEFIVATEAGILHQMQKVRPGATLIPAPPSTGCNCSLCPYMRLNTMEKVYLCMRDKQPEILVDEATRVRALQPVERMLALG